MSRRDPGDFVRSLFALDGVRVCYETLEDLKPLSELCSGVGPWKRGEYWGFTMGSWEGEFDEIVADIRERFGMTRGRLEPMMVGRSKAARALERELGAYWESIPPRVREDLITAEYKRLALKDATYDLWDVAHNYCLAVERIVNRRLGLSLAAYIDANLGLQEVASFRKKHLNGGNFSASGLTIHQWEKVLKDKDSVTIFAKANLDTRYILEELPGRVFEFIPFRVEAHHARVELDKKREALSGDDLDNLRSMLLDPKTGIVAVLSKMRVVFPE